MKRVIAVMLAVSMMFSLSACKASQKESSERTTQIREEGFSVSGLKVGLILDQDQEEADKSQEEALKGEAQKLGLDDEQIMIMETSDKKSCYDTAVELAKKKCNIIFAGKADWQQDIIKAAREFPKIAFCLAGGTKEDSIGLTNIHCFYTKVYEARYLSGIVAGQKLKNMIKSGQLSEENCKAGYVASYPYSEVVSAFSSFFLGMRSVCDSVSMEVRYTDRLTKDRSKEDIVEELAADGCVLIAQGTDDTGILTACEQKQILCVGYNADIEVLAPKYGLTSVDVDWSPYYSYALNAVIHGTEISGEWAEGLSAGAVFLKGTNDTIVPKNTSKKIMKTQEAITDGSLQVFDTSTFTIGGRGLEELIQSGDSMASDIAGYVFDGAFHESDVEQGMPSAPSFAFIIDGIDSAIE